ncbi:RNA polymerase subunit sigma-24 [Vandammella animalimorsus]|uniref:RNA polymerase subunit sigma-24 n=1 Tax=Vandammella animalimorsus TaxID=2029117 RepID=A0A2A2T463_9BURK|nr:sigma-70 family RNA polymerase sigma factor [Vandammella animalimorsus]PAT31365.1 RNA polymerase subunit sigma-24 [Vandammella animalimorsus]PAX16356.1 RNA polymerase subunit sigma-24 [Vandammella animalimorsus]PAX18771.1 RNA polymerase subunit sigma-24 [Vandammella animalimorsus]
MRSSHPDSDEALMLAYAAGHSKSFDALYSRHEAGMLRFIARTLGRAQETHVEEVFQETWLRIISGRNSFRPQGAQWRTWAFAIAHHTAMDHLRRIQRQPATVASLQAQEEAASQASEAETICALPIHPHAAQPASQIPTDEQVFWRAAGQQLLRCLEELPPEQRAAFLLKHEEDCSLQELAVHLGIGFEALRSRLRYSLQKLRQCMGSYLSALHSQS